MSAALSPQERLIVAVDASTRAEALALIERLPPQVRWVKIGAVLFAAEGPDLVREIVASGRKVFLDLKLHDIPHQVGLTAAAVAKLGVHLLTLHASGGTAMMRAAVESCAGTPCRLLAVTVLTSLDAEALAAIGVAEPPAQAVLRRARLAIDAGVDGVVASPREAAALRELLGPGPEIVTPGIRPAGSAHGDQRRVATPSDAIRAGASRLVVGRPITRASDPAAAADAVCAEIAGAAS